MAEETLKKIKEIEEKAEEIIKQAKHTAFLNIKKTHERHKEEIEFLQKETKKEAENLLQAAEAEAVKEAGRIEENSKKEIEELKEKVKPKIETAKKEILQWLS